MNIALLNMMSDAALKATDIQFRSLLAGPGDAVLHPFTLPEIARSEKAANYISESYQTWEQIQALAPDAMIITGANISDPNLETQVFWEPLREIMDWAEQNIKSTLCSCLASHAVMQFRFDQLRRPLPRKVWGVYEHRTLLPDHPLAVGLPVLVPVPQSRHNEVTAGQFQSAGLNVILAHSYARVHLAANRDNSLVLMQGHPEYDGVSLLKEYKREVRFFAEGLREDYPPMPDNIVDDAGVELLLAHGKQVREATAEGGAVPEFPESEATGHLHEDWKPAAEQVFANWLEIVRKFQA